MIHMGYDARGKWHQTAGNPDFLCGSRAAGRLLLTILLSAATVLLGLAVAYFTCWRKP